MSHFPSVRRMVLFKHGVAYLERGGPAEGAFELSFKRDEMSDVLKSLAVWVARGEAKVGAVAFDAPEDPEAALAERALAFEPAGALRGLIHALRGRRVRVDDGASPREGEVLGVEESQGRQGEVRRQLLLRVGEGRVALVDLESVRNLEPLEEPSRADLEFFVDKGRAATAGVHRAVRISLEGRAEDLRVAYAIPAPAWRVSYRIAREGGSGVERARLMAWGIVFNPADEDLEGISLTLTTGQPVSFAIDLYNPKHVARAVVEEESRAAVPPRRFERAKRPEASASVARAAMPSPAAFAPAFDAGPDTSRMGAGDALDDAYEKEPLSVRMSDTFAQASGAEGAERGEFFEYRVGPPVSLKRGGSAMVPLASAELPVRRERIWRDGSGPAPDLVLTFENASGAVLEEGPAVIYDEGVYAGEAMVPYAARGAEVKLGFAKDLALRCRRRTTSSSFASALRLDARFLAEEIRHEEAHTLYAESDHAEAVSVLFELPKVHGKDLHPDSPRPSEETASFRRFGLDVPAGGSTETSVREVWVEARRVSYEHLAASQLEAWLRGKLLDGKTASELAGVLLGWQRARELDGRRAAVERAQQEAHGRQAKVTAQLAVLKDSGPEGALRLRYVKELEADQARIVAATAEIDRLAREAEAERRAATDELERITAARGE